MAKRGRGARIKGAAFERKIAEELTALTEFSWKRGLGQTRRGGAEVPDVHCDDLKHIHIEVKRQKQCSIKAAMRQAVGDVEESGKLPIVITKDDRQPIYVTMRFEEWVDLFNAYLQPYK